LEGGGWALGFPKSIVIFLSSTAATTLIVESARRKKKCFMVRRGITCLEWDWEFAMTSVR
jgi:hypothetical protein